TVHGSRITGRQSQATVLSPLQGHSRKGGGAGLGGRRKRVSCNERRPNSCQDHPIGLCESSWVFFPSWRLPEVYYCFSAASRCCCVSFSVCPNLIFPS